MNLQSLDLLHSFSRRFHGSCQEGERPARGRVVPRGDLAPMRSNNAERTLHPLWVKSRHLQCTNPCPLYPPKADMCDPTRDARFGPLADICRAYSITSSAALSRPNGTER